MSAKESREALTKSQVVQFCFFKVNRQWRLLPPEARESGRRAFEEEISETGSTVHTHSYSTIGLRKDADLMLWRRADALEPLQESLSRLLRTGLGVYLDVSHLFFGLIRPSVYTGRRTSQEQAVDMEERQAYFVLYPFTKTTEWYLLSKEARQGMMNEHIRVGRSYSSIRQILLYSTGLADQEFVVGYETDVIEEFQDLVIALRSTEARRYTLADTPIFTCIHRPLGEALAMLG